MTSTERDLVERLREDAKPGYGLDFTDTDKERADYWSAVAQRLRRDCTEAADALASIRAERDAAVELLGKVSRSLTGLTPGGSEYHSHSKVLDTYYADTDACERVIRDRFDSGHKAKLELIEARADKARVDELLTAAVDDYNETLAERDMAERAAVEAAIPLEALLMAGQGPLSDAVWDGVRNGVGHVRSMLKARAARAIAGEQKNDA